MKVIGCAGVGSFGKVLKVQVGDHFFAIKKISLDFDLEDDSEELTCLKREADLLTKCLYHPNVVRCYSSFRKNDCFFIVMEYVGHRSLNDVVLPINNQNQIVNVIIQLAMGLKHLKNNRIVHRDIKPTNILISEKGLLKIADFGISKQIQNDQHAYTCLGTPFYTAPEIIQEKSYDYSVDVWSLGVVLYEMVHGYLPFEANNMSELKKKIRWTTPDIKNDIHHDLRLILRGCLAKQPSNRLTVDQILRIPLIRAHMADKQQIVLVIIDP